MHQLEKAALDDPFMAEALEGMLDFSGPGRSQDLQELERMIAAKADRPAGAEGQAMPGNTRNIPGTVGEKDEAPGISQQEDSRFRIPPAPVFRNRNFRMAAAIVLLIGLGLVTTWIFNRTPAPIPGLASNEERSRVTDTTPAASLAPMTGQAADSASATAPAQVPVGAGSPDLADEPGTVPVAEQKPSAKTNPVQAAAPTDARDIAARKETPVDVSGNGLPSKKETEEVAAARDIAAAPAARADAEKSMHASGAAPQKDNRLQEVATVPPNKARMKASQPGTTEKMTGPYVFTGQVKDPDGKPLSFVNIRIRNSAASTYSDAKGNYRILSGDSSLVIDLKAVGYQGRTLALETAHPNQQVLMQPAGVKDMEKNLKPKASSREEMTKVDDGNIQDDEKPEAEPTDGWGAYQYYLLNNIRIPADASRQKLHGTVEISFLVADNGRLSDIRVEKSLSPSCDREAVRLLKEGPAWTLYNSEKPLRARVTVVF
jgi:TonB family protein